MKALLLAAGYGTRLGNLTLHCPKAMLPLGDKPLIHYTLNYLAASGFDDIIINLHFLPGMIRDYCGSGQRFGLHIHYAYEPALLGTAGALPHLAPHLAPEEDALVLYGDILTDQDLRTLVAFHQERKADATLVVHKRHRSNSMVRLNPAGRITDFVERPKQPAPAGQDETWVNSGIQVINQRLLSLLPAKRPADLPLDVYIPHLKIRAFFGFPLTGFRCAIDSPERYKQATEAVSSAAYQPAIFPYPIS